MKWLSTVGACALAFTGGLVAGHAAPAREAFAQGREAAAESAEGPHSHEIIYNAGARAGRAQAGHELFRACLDTFGDEGRCDSMLDRGIDIAEGGADALR